MSHPEPALVLDVTARTAVPAALAALDLPARIRRLRQLRLEGICVSLRPYQRTDGEALRALRNLPNNKANLAQTADITPEQQRSWEDGYFARANDLCWILLTPAGEFAGSVSLYDIDPTSAETGRLVIREEVARTSPIIAECELLIQWLAFAWLGLLRVLAHIQPANAKMVVMHERTGFRVTGPSSIRGVPYLQLEVEAGRFHPEPHLKVLRHWRTRDRATPGSTRPA